MAQAREVVEQIAGGLEGRIEQGGANLSGGQRQRLAIARALVRRPPSTSSTTASPPSTTRPTPGCAPRSAPTPTPRRWSSWRNGSAASLTADRIVVLDEGRVAGVGTHAELLETCPTYTEIVASQLQEAPA